MSVLFMYQIWLSVSEKIRQSNKQTDIQVNVFATETWYFINFKNSSILPVKLYLAIILVKNNCFF